MPYVLEGTLYPEIAQEIAFIMACNGTSNGNIEIVEICGTLVLTCRFQGDRFSRENDDTVAETTAFIQGVALTSNETPEIEIAIAIYNENSLSISTAACREIIEMLEKGLTIEGFMDDNIVISE